MLFKELISLNSLVGSDVLTVCPLADNIKNVTFIDSPDGSGWIKEGDFVLTTGYFITGTDDWEERFFMFIVGLIDRKGAGLGVKIGRHIPYLPESIRLYASERNFLILRLNNEPAWSDFLWEITHALSEAKDDEIRQLNTVYEKFHRHLKDKGDINRLAEVLYSIIELPLTIYLKKMNIRVDYPSKPIHDMDLDYMITTAFSGISNEIQTVKYGETIFKIKWINEKSNLEGGIFIWSNEKELTPKLKVAVDQAAMIANLEVEHQNSIKAVEQRHLNEFILELVHGTFESQEFIHNKMRDLELHLDDFYRVILIYIDQENGITQEQLISGVTAIPQLDLTRVMIGQTPERHLLVIAPEELHDSTIALTTDYLKVQHKKMKIIIGMSRCYNILDLAHAFKEAKIAMTISKENKVNDDRMILTNFENLDLERVLFSESVFGEAEQIYKETLHKVIEHDRQHKSDLFNTLSCYFESNLNVELTAERLFIHKNTVRYRLKLISSLIGLDFAAVNTIVLCKIAFNYYYFESVVL